MAENSKIEWCDHTFNPWEGCTKVSPGCANCYAEARNSRFGGGCAPNWGPGKPRRRTSEANWKKPLRWDREAANNDMSRELAGDNPHRPRVFSASLADWLDIEVPLEWRVDFLELVRTTPNLDWLLLTKRPELWLPLIEGSIRWIEALPDWSDVGPHKYAALRDWLGDWVLFRRAPANVWIGTTVEDQTRADQRIPELLKIPARVRFLSCEPLLGPVNVANWGWRNTRDSDARIHWVICGGESGPNARPMHPDWARSLRDQCAAAGVPYFFKQFGEWAPGECLTKRGTINCAWWAGDGQWAYGRQTEKESEDCHADDAPDLYYVGKHAAGRLLDGREHSDFPEVRHA